LGGTVPLSEHEQRQLEQIEQALYADYPRFANAVKASDPRVHYRRRLVQAGLGLLAGLAMLVAGILTRYIWIGAAGLVVIVISCVWALHSYRRMAGTATTRRPGSKSKRRRRGRGHPASPGMMERLEERWRRRQERDR
jgi:hypothetical protein